MSEVTGKLTVFFEDPFWVGVFERVEDGRLSVCRVVFGAEPKDGQVWELVLGHYGALRFGPAVEAALKKENQNPKRLQRQARKEIQKGVGTRAQQALQRQREEAKAQRQAKGREQKRAQDATRYELKKGKRREKRRGR